MTESDSSANKEIAKLVKRAMRGNQRAFAQLCRLKARAVIFAALAYVGNLADAEDVAQEVFVLMFRKFAQLKAPEAFNAWLSTIVRNCSLRFLEKHRHQRSQVSVDDEALDLADEDSDVLPAEALESKELSEQIYRSIMELPERQRETLILYYYQELQYNEIAEMQGVTVSTVSTNIKKAKAAMRRKLEDPQLGAGLSAGAGAGTGDGAGGGAGSNLNNGATSAKPMLFGALIASTLTEQANILVSDAAVAKVQAATMATLSSLGLSSAATSASTGAGASLVSAASLIGIKVATAVIAIALVAGLGVAAVVASGTFSSDTSGTSAKASESRIVAEAPGEIVFVGGISDTGWVNPESIALVESAAAPAQVSWAIYAAGGGAAGDGAADATGDVGATASDAAGGGATGDAATVGGGAAGDAAAGVGAADGATAATAGDAATDSSVTSSNAGSGQGPALARGTGTEVNLSEWGLVVASGTQSGRAAVAQMTAYRIIFTYNDGSGASVEKARDFYLLQ